MAERSYKTKYKGIITWFRIHHSHLMHSSLPNRHFATEFGTSIKGSFSCSLSLIHVFHDGNMTMAKKRPYSLDISVKKVQSVSLMWLINHKCFSEVEIFQQKFDLGAYCVYKTALMIRAHKTIEFA